jgi:hypothetical protein
LALLQVHLARLNKEQIAQAVEENPDVRIVFGFDS